MGGLAGHISHLWEDVNLKFSSLLELYSQAQQGKLTATEKFDGLNLCFTASDDLKSLVFARNKTDTKIGGVSKEEIASRLPDRDHLRETFLEGAKKLNRTFVKLTFDERNQAFLRDNHKTWYSADIIDSRSVNILKYDVDCVVVHETIINEDFELETFSTNEFFANCKEIATKNHCVLKHTNKTFNGCKEKYFARAKKQLTNFLIKYDVTENDAIGDLLLSAVPGIRFSEHFLKTNKDVRDTLFQLDVINSAFTSEVLVNNASELISEPSLQIITLENNLKQKVEYVKSKDIEQHTIVLEKQIKKLSKISAIEGLVFKHAGSFYKMTGSFSALNQIMGIDRYARC